MDGQRGISVLNLNRRDEYEHGRQQRIQKQRDEREKARRILIYRHMIATTGKIHFDLIHQWTYEPSRADVQEMHEILLALACTHSPRRTEAERRMHEFDQRFQFAGGAA